MKTLFILIGWAWLITSCSAQTGEAIIKFEPVPINFYDSSLIQVCKGKGIIRLTFSNEDGLNVKESELIYVNVIDSMTNKVFLEYRKGDSNQLDRRLKLYSNKLDSIFKNMKYEIVNKNYKTFIPRADFPFVFKVSPIENE